MLLACDYTEDGKEKVELLTAPWAAPGTIIQIEGAEYTSEKSWQQARPLKKVSNLMAPDFFLEKKSHKSGFSLLKSKLFVFHFLIFHLEL